MNIIRSIGKDQKVILKDILDLHNHGNAPDLDCTYSTGNFYKGGLVPEPIFKSDLVPQLDGIIQANSGNLPFSSESMNCVVFDPPFIVHGNLKTVQKSGSCRIFKRFSGYKNYGQLKTHYKDTLEETYRILKTGGKLIMKLQNTVSGGKQHLTHFFTISNALAVGFYPKDEFVLESKGKITSFGGRWKTQQHAMKYHSYFMVFEKSNKKIDYTV